MCFILQNPEFYYAVHLPAVHTYNGTETEVVQSFKYLIFWLDCNVISKPQ